MASAELLSQRYPSATVMPIYNGFEPIAWPEGSLSANARRRIVYAGSLYGGLRSPELLFCALSQLPENVRHRLDVVFCGTPEPSFDHDVQQWGLGDCVSHVGLLSREQATALMRSADVLLTISWDDSGERRVLPGKVFEYLSTERPILAVGASADSELGRFLSRTDAGTVASDLASVITCLNAIADTGFPTGQAGIRCDVEQFTQKVMAERFLDLIRGIRT
jgi:glycosyltransferase involved in cell wall biosynthesis